jgi:hypothetical protein
MKPSRVPAITRRNIEIKDALQMEACVCLLALEVRRNAHKPIANESISGVAGLKRDTQESSCNEYRLVKVTTVKVKSPQCPQRSQLSVHLPESFGGFECPCQILPGAFA